MPKPPRPGPAVERIEFPDLEKHKAHVEGYAAKVAALRLTEQGHGEATAVFADMLDTMRLLLRAVEMLTTVTNLARENEAAARQREAAARAELARLKGRVQ